MKALAETNFDLFHPAMPAVMEVSTRLPEIETLPETRPPLPDLPRLYVMFDSLNARYFQGKLPPTEISYSTRMLIAGSFSPNTNEIKIGRKYHEIFPDELEDTLKHEMIHIINRNHDRRFKAIAGKIGASVRARTHPALQGNCKYLYVCLGCGREYPRRKRLRMASCGVCTKGKSFDPRFKLKLLKSSKKR
ncbi:MAG: SprT-like domain-containing protein [Candidatus Zixiibacteriota bacterium]|nr:MAG: SprT-like domain-containing protein [candidate division Zixibacteria bacterium]